MDTLGLVIALVLAGRLVEIHCQKPVDHGVRVAPDRRCEMGVESECQSVVSDVLGAVHCLRHRPQGNHLEGIALRTALGLLKQGVERAGNLASVAHRAHLVAEIAGELVQ